MIALPRWLKDGHPLVERVQRGEPTAACSVVWYEFLTGPVDEDELRLAEAFIERRVLAIDADHARLAAQLFNAGGRKRGWKTDALIAAVAIHSGAELLTVNLKDFAPFVAAGLRLMA